MPVTSILLDGLLRRRTHGIDSLCEMIANQPAKSAAEHQYPWRKYADIPLHCPVFNSRMRVPGRMSGCLHLESFDLEQFLRRESLWPRLSCPICGNRSQNGLEGLCIDQAVQSALSWLPSTVSRFILRADGYWRLHPPLNLPPDEQWQPMIGPSTFAATHALDQLFEEVGQPRSSSTTPSYSQHVWQSPRPPSTPNHSSPGTPVPSGHKTPSKAPFPNIPGVNMTSGLYKCSDDMQMECTGSRTAQLDYLLSQEGTATAPRLKRTLSGSSSTSTMSAATPALGSSVCYGESNGGGSYVVQMPDGTFKRVKTSPTGTELTVPSASLNDSSTDKFLEDDLFNNNGAGAGMKNCAKIDVHAFIAGPVTLRQSDLTKELVDGLSFDDVVTESFLRPDYVSFVINNL
ncbi:hypothetical protein Ciccas_000540 [Cichlidogyrus casuarinus]|uniref:SP-RING-type domain-containing protein n=1 Tax=Cichlidogyrus casuarinus TaxID=1844966 RepID=A0ABD2QMS7_9PLAT